MDLNAQSFYCHRLIAVNSHVKGCYANNGLVSSNSFCRNKQTNRNNDPDTVPISFTLKAFLEKGDCKMNPLGPLGAFYALFIPHFLIVLAEFMHMA